MVYAKQVWTDNVTPVDAAHMNHIESGIASVSGVAPSTTPPASPADGDFWFLPADANGSVWMFRYNAGSSSAYKWEFVGGSPLWAEVPTYEAAPVSGTLYGDFPTVGPALTAPRAGDYVLLYTAYLETESTSQSIGVAPKIGSTAATDVDAINGFATDGGVGSNGAREVRKTISAAATVVTLQGRSSATSQGFAAQRTLSLRPVRVS